MAKQALCIGINNYPGTQMDLQGCVNDAQDWRDVLRSRGFQVSLLLDAQATKAAMMQAMTELLNTARAGDSLVITFSGHGTYQPDSDSDEADGLDEALCPYDIQTQREALTDDEIRALFAQRPAAVKLLLISDSCHSGTVTRAAPAAAAADAPRVRFMPLANWLPEARLPRSRVGTSSRQINAPVRPSPWHSALLEAAGDVLLAGCQEGPNHFSYDAKIADRYNGVFTYYALKTLTQLPATASYAAWHQAIRAYLPSASYPQSPQIQGDAAACGRVLFS